MGGEKSAVFVFLCLKEQTTVEKVDQIKDFFALLTAGKCCTFKFNYSSYVTNLAKP